MKTVLIFLAILVAFVGAQSGPTKLSPGFTVRASTARQSWSYFYVELSEATINYVSIASVASVGDPFYYFAYSSLPTFSNYFWKKENTNNFTKIIPNPNVDLDTGVVNNTRLYIGVYGYTASKYSLLATTQGPYTLRDRRARNNTGLVNSYVFYKLSIDRRVRQFQAVNQGNPVLAGSNMLYLTNSTSYYPLYRRNMWEATSTRYYDCLTLENPAPGNYRLAVDVIANPELIEKNSTAVTFKVSKEVNLSVLVKVIEAQRKPMHIKNWGFSESNLEDIFLTIVMKDEEKISLEAKRGHEHSVDNTLV